MEKGNTFLAVDSIHGEIGKIMKKTPIIGDFDAFANICEQAGKNTRAVIMDYDDLYPFKKIVRSRNSGTEKLPLLSDLVEIQFRTG